MILESEFVDLNTPTGVMRTYVHRPKSTSKFPAILFYSEIFQQTGPIERAAKILASHGFVVLVPEVFHELNEIGTVLNYDDAGRDKGNADKSEKDVQSYDTDNQAMIDWINTQKWSNGHIGAMGFCIGGHLAFRAALNPSVKATACFYATDLHTNTIPNKSGQHSMERLSDIQGELLMIWGKQDKVTPPIVGERFNELIDHSELHWVDECGHAPMMEKPDDFNQILEGFLKGLRADA